MKVLVIEDDPGIIEVVSLCFQLRWSGTSVISAESGSRGVELVETESPDVVILDIGLPDMDGYSVLKEVRRFSDVPVLMLTVRGEDTDVAAEQAPQVLDQALGAGDLGLAKGLDGSIDGKDQGGAEVVHPVR